MLNEPIAQRIVDRLRRRGFDHCTVTDVREVHETGTLEDAALASAIIQELEEYGLL